MTDFLRRSDPNPLPLYTTREVTVHPMSTRGCMQACTAQQKWMETHCDFLAHSQCTFLLSFMQTHLRVVSELLICSCENDIRTDFNSENDNANKILELPERQYLTLHGRYLLSQGYVLIVSALNMKLSKPFGYSDMTLHHLSHTHTHIQSRYVFIKSVLSNA